MWEEEASAGKETRRALAHTLLTKTDWFLRKSGHMTQQEMCHRKRL